MDDTLRADLREQIESRQALLIVGAGAARSAAPSSPVADWKGLLRHGIGRCLELDVEGALGDGWRERLHEELDSDDVDDLLSVATKVERKLKRFGEGEYRRWLADTVGAVRVEEPAWIDALLGLGLPVATTNYDSLFTERSGLAPVTWREGDKLQEVLRGDREGVLHLHGHWDDPRSVVLGIESYDKMLSDELAQDLVRAGAALRTFVLVGFGAGLEDPNFAALRDWLARRFAASKYRTYRLVRADEVARVQAQHARDERVFAVAYGEHYEDLPGFLSELTPQSETPGETRGTAPRTVVRDPLRLYRNRVRQEHDRLVPFFQDQLPNAALEQVYVELEVSTDNQRRAPQDAEAFAVIKRGHRTLESLLALATEIGGGSHPRWVVRGDPGCGKTTLLRHLAWKLADEGGEARVPVFLRLRELVAAKGGRGNPWKRIGHLLEQSGHDAELVGLLEELRGSGRLAVLIDGLDEVPPDKARAGRELLAILGQDLGPSPLVVTSRRIGYEPLGGEFREADVLPLRREQQVRLVQQCCDAASENASTRTAAEWVDEFAAEPALLPFASNPLLLTLMSLLVRRGERPSSLRSELYDQVIELLLEGQQKPRPEPIACKEEVRAALACVAERMTERGETAAKPSVLESHLRRMERAGDEEAECLAVVRSEWSGGLRSALDAIAEQTGVLGPYDGPSAPWRYWHRTFQEALTAERLLRLSPDKIEARAERLEEHLDLWAEPFALLTGKLEDPDGLILSLVRANRPLALRALATAQRVSTATIEEVLAFGSEDGEERWAVYGRVLDQVGDAARGLDLLDSLRGRTTSGADLYFIDRAYVAAAEAHPLLAERVRDLRSRIFNHRPPPDPELFSRVVTKSGPVSFWADVPAGTFDMGSVEGEWGSYEDERPLHAVRIDRPFQMASTPITNEQFHAFDPSHEPEARDGVPSEELDRHPVVNVCWYDAVMFCRWLGARLPSEAEWEYACRAGSPHRAYFSGELADDLAEVGWYDDNADHRTHAVGKKRANAFGLYDVHGNVWEWCQDRWSSNYEESQTSHPEAFEPDISEDERVVRGGGFYGPAVHARSASRFRTGPAVRYDALGFRPARVITD